MTSGLGKTRPQKNRTPKKMLLLSKPSKQKNSSGVKTTTMEQECGLSTTETSGRVDLDPTRQRPMLISPPSTRWIATPNDCYARIKVTLVLGDSVLSPFLVVRPKRRGDDNNGLPLDILRPACHNARRLRF